MTTSRFVLGLVTATAALSFGSPVHALPNVDVFVDGTAVGSVTWVSDGFGGYKTNQTTFGDLGIDLYQVRVGNSFATPTSNTFGNGWDFGYGLGFTFTTSTAKTLKLVYDVDFLGPVGPSVTADSSLIGTLVDGTGGGVGITAPASGHVQTVTFIPGSGDNVALSVGPTLSGPATGNSGTSYQYGEYAVTQPVTGNWTGFQVVSEFTLAPGSSAVALDGVLSVSAVPEPNAYTMMVAGLLAIGFIGSSRHLQRQLLFLHLF
jgi:hypothetical protein